MKKKHIVKENTKPTEMKKEETARSSDGLQETGPQRQGEEMTVKEQRGKIPTPSKKGDTTKINKK